MAEGKGLALPYTFFAGGDSPDFAAQQNFQHIVTFINRRLARISEIQSSIVSSVQTFTTATLVDVTGFTVPILDDATYRVELHMLLHVSSDGMDIQFNVPTGSTFDGLMTSLISIGGGSITNDFRAVAENTEYANFLDHSVGGTVEAVVNVTGILSATSDGDFSVQMSKNIDAGIDSSIRVGSTISLTTTQVVA